MSILKTLIRASCLRNPGFCDPFKLKWAGSLCKQEMSHLTEQLGKSAIDVLSISPREAIGDAGTRAISRDSYSIHLLMGACDQQSKSRGMCQM